MDFEGIFGFRCSVAGAASLQTQWSGSTRHLLPCARDPGSFHLGVIEVHGSMSRCPGPVQGQLQELRPPVLSSLTMKEAPTKGFHSSTLPQWQIHQLLGWFQAFCFTLYPSGRRAPGGILPLAGLTHWLLVSLLHRRSLSTRPNARLPGRNRDAGCFSLD